MSIRLVRQCIRLISKCQSTRRMSFDRIKAQLNLLMSARTIRRELRRAGYRRCITCPRPFISRPQAKMRLAFSHEHRWWGTSDYAAHREDGRQGGDQRKVVWSDEATFETGKSRRIWVTRRVDERRCLDYIQSIYRSGRTSVMIWGAIGWDYKSELVFIEKLLQRKGICSRTYLEQVLQPIVFPLFNKLGPEYIFIEDRAKVYKGDARLLRLQHGIRGFNQPPSSPDLNLIEKVWRQMKEMLKKLPYVPKNKEDLQREL